MIEIRFANDVASALSKAGFLLVVAPRSFFAAEKLKGIFDDSSTTLLLELAAEVNPGHTGALATSLTGGTPGRIAVGVLPDTVSRYNAPSRAECIRHILASVKSVRQGSAAVVLILEAPEHLLAGVNAVHRALPTFSVKSIKKDQKGRKKSKVDQPSGSLKRLELVVLDAKGKVIKVPDTMRTLCTATRDAAQHVDMPPADLHPTAFVKEARRLLKGSRLSWKEIAGNQLLDSGLGGIHAVGRCAEHPPRLLVADWNPPGAKGPHVALVGKGITYDTGGLHLKARGSMEGMKADMGGAAAVLGAFRSIVAAKVPRRVSMLLCIAENAIGPAAFRPDDILTMHSGKTVEINNTDAEGRLVLADGVSYAARVLRADIILDAATLTGAQMIATGLMHGAIVSNDEELESLAVQVGKRSGDLVHPLPFAPELYQQEFVSQLADMRNSVKNRNNAQSSCAAQFIYSHIEDTPARWLHLDIAGPAWRSERGTGFGVAFLAELVRSL